MDHFARDRAVARRAMSTTTDASDAPVDDETKLHTETN
jgi:hypothetical protein